jgi:hypothetical protein
VVLAATMSVLIGIWPDADPEPAAT